MILVFWNDSLDRNEEAGTKGFIKYLYFFFWEEGVYKRNKFYLKF